MNVLRSYFCSQILYTRVAKFRISLFIVNILSPPTPQIKSLEKVQKLGYFYSITLCQFVYLKNLGIIIQLEVTKSLNVNCK